MSAPQALCPIISSFEPLKKNLRKHLPHLDSNQLFISLKDAKCEHSFCEHQCFFRYVPFHECKFFSRNCTHYCLDRRDKLTRGDDERGNLLPQLKYRTWTEHPEFDDSLRIDMCNSRHLQHTRRDRKVTTSKTCDCTSFPFFVLFH